MFSQSLCVPSGMIKSTYQQGKSAWPLGKDDVKFVKPLKNKENMNKPIAYLKVSKDDNNIK